MLEVKNLHVKVDGKQILKGVDLTVNKGEVHAIMGPNGSGKSTLSYVMAGKPGYEATEGQILLDGIDLREYVLEDLHRHIGVIFQDFMRFEMTARENIGVGRVDQPYEDSDIEVAAHKSLADTVVAKLAGGYDQMLGRRFEGGVELSGGEWQRFVRNAWYLAP